MKYKTNEEPQSNSFLEDILDLLVLNKQFVYVVSIQRKKKGWENCGKLAAYQGRLMNDRDNITKLAISLNPEHVEPTFTVEFSPIESIKDLKDYEEKYYNMLKEIAKNALEEKEIEVLAYLSNIIMRFEHYFCTLDESNISRETSSQ